MRYPIEQQVIRTVLALCTLAGVSEEQDIRDDMHDEASAVVYLWFRVLETSPNSGEPGAFLRQWCERLARRLDVLAGETGQPMGAVLAAHTAVLRLRTALGIAPTDVQTPSARPPSAPIPERARRETLSHSGSIRVSGKNQEKVLEFVRDHSDVRTKELVKHFAGVLSDRTIKRCLKELAAGGIIVRARADDGSVTYAVDTQQ